MADCYYNDAILERVYNEGKTDCARCKTPSIGDKRRRCRFAHFGAFAAGAIRVGRAMRGRASGGMQLDQQEYEPL